MKKLVLSIFILVVGFSILSGVVIAKDQIFVQAQTEEQSSVAGVIGDALALPGSQTAFVEDVIAVGTPKEFQTESITFEGSVAAVDINDGIFDVHVSENDLRAFVIDSETEFLDDLRGIEDLSAAMEIDLIAVPAEDGSYHVVSISGFLPEEQTSSSQGGEPRSSSQGSTDQNSSGVKIDVGGRVTSVGANTLTIQTQDGDPMTFAITESTIFSSYIGSHDSLDDIKVNFTVAVIYFDGEMVEGLRAAYRVVVANEGIAFNANTQGWVDSASATSLTLTTNWGTTYTFMIDSSTQIRGVGSAAEITAGMRAFVYYQDTGSGLVAKGIQVWP